MSVLRRRIVASDEKEEESSTFLEKFRELDAFTKITEEAEAPQTSRGGVCTMVTFSIMMLLLLGEMTVWFTTTKIKYEFDVDSEYESKMHLNMDITFNSPCHMISADIVDSSGDAWGYSFQLQEDAADFELTKEKALERAKLLKMKESMTDPNMRDQLLREGHDVKHLEFSRQKNKKMMDAGMMHKVVQINLDPNEPQGCRVWGSVELQKIAGTIKIQGGGFGGMGGIPGLSGGLDAIMGMFMMPMMGMGAQIQDGKKANFSHRIDHFSFGDPSSGLVYGLDGDIQIQEKENDDTTYVVKVVPTDLKTFKFQQKAYQYAVTQHVGKSEKPAVTIKYDFSGLGVSITEYRESFVGLLTRLAGILGGIAASSGILANVLNVLS